MKIVRFILVVLEIALIAVPDLYYRAAFATGNAVVVLAFFVINIAFIKNLDYLIRLVNNLEKPTR